MRWSCGGFLYLQVSWCPVWLSVLPPGLHRTLHSVGAYWLCLSVWGQPPGAPGHWKCPSLMLLGFPFAITSSPGVICLVCVFILIFLTSSYRSVMQGFVSFPIQCQQKQKFPQFLSLWRGHREVTLDLHSKRLNTHWQLVTIRCWAKNAIVDAAQ